VPNAVGLKRALEAGQSSIDHMDGWTESPEIEPAAFLAAKAFIVPTMKLWETFYGREPVGTLRQRGELKYMPQQTVEGWAKAVAGIREKAAESEASKTLDLRCRLLGQAAAAGVKIALGTDAPQLFSVPGFSVHREVELMSKCGMSARQILDAGTRVAAEYFGASGDFGVIAPGKRADMVLLEANPLENIAYLQRRAGVVVRGRWLPEAEIQKRLAEIAARHGNAARTAATFLPEGIRPGNAAAPPLPSPRPQGL
jgi:imidazolonepropionase-like amidohydrolase